MNSQVLKSKIIGEHKYEVFYDFDYNINDMDFENEQDKQDYMSKLDQGVLNIFGVVKYDICPCCCIWREVDTLWGLHFETAEEAMNDYLTNHEV